MTKKQLNEFEAILLAQQKELVNRSGTRKGSDFTIDKNEIMDEIDHATVETAQSIEINLRGREKLLYNKIELALEKISKGDFGICEECEGKIEIKRLKARPVTTLCISCKEFQEQSEKLTA